MDMMQLVRILGEILGRQKKYHPDCCGRHKYGSNLIFLHIVEKLLNIGKAVKQYHSGTRKYAHIQLSYG